MGVVLVTLFTVAGRTPQMLWLQWSIIVVKRHKCDINYSFLQTTITDIVTTDIVTTASLLSFSYISIASATHGGHTAYYRDTLFRVLAIYVSVLQVQERVSCEEIMNNHC